VTSEAGALYFHRLVSALGPNEDGLTDDEVLEVEARYGFTFPPDLRALLHYCLPVSVGPWQFPNWRVESDHLRSQLSAPLEGVLFDVECNSFWWPSWGERPAELDKAVAIASACFALVPKLVPVFGHRYMPSGATAGAPVFSISQTDVIYYGYSLQGYFRNEFHIPVPPDGLTEPLYVPFWGDIAEASAPGPHDWWSHKP
jgi:hypothetical protein